MDSKSLTFRHCEYGLCLADWPTAQISLPKMSTVIPWGWKYPNIGQGIDSWRRRCQKPNIFPGQLTLSSSSFEGMQIFRDPATVLSLGLSQTSRFAASSTICPRLVPRHKKSRRDQQIMKHDHLSGQRWQKAATRLLGSTSGAALVFKTRGTTGVVGR